MRTQIILVTLFCTTLSLVAASEKPAGREPDAESVSSLMSRFRGLAGVWRGHSSKGWDETESYTLAGKGSTVMAVSHFIDTPEDSMVTMFHVDGDRMLLTHYCEEGNQPRLVASEIGPGGSTATFTFLDGTGLKEHPGHMHTVKFEFQDADHFTSQWSYFANGHESWTEKIAYERARHDR
jgi:hypothetical protein